MHVCPGHVCPGLAGSQYLYVHIYTYIYTNIYVYILRATPTAAGPRRFKNLSKMFQESSQKLSKIDFGGCLDAIAEPPVCRGDPKTSFSMIFGHFGTPVGDQFSVILGTIF